MSDQELQEIQRRVEAAMSRRGVPAASSPTEADSTFGYFIIVTESAVQLFWHQADPGAWNAQLKFAHTYGPQLAAQFGHGRVKLRTRKLRKAGRLRMIVGLEVTLART